MRLRPQSALRTGALSDSVSVRSLRLIQRMAMLAPTQRRQIGPVRLNLPRSRSQSRTLYPNPLPSPTAATTVKRFLGEGGKKKVYLAHDAQLDRDVAFALIKTEGLDEAAATARHPRSPGHGTPRLPPPHRHRLRHRRRERPALSRAASTTRWRRRGRDRRGAGAQAPDRAGGEDRHGDLYGAGVLALAKASSTATSSPATSGSPRTDAP